MESVSVPGMRELSYLLIADDDVDDQELIRDALLENNFSKNQLRFVNDGEELINALKSATTLPSLILLDLNMPRKGGMQVLTEMREDAKLKHIPVIVFSTSSDELDVKQAYSIGSNAYMTKPPSYTELVDSMQALTSYWFVKAKLVR